MPLMDRDKSPYKNTTDEKAEQVIRDLIRKRGILKGRLTKFVNHLHSLVKPLGQESRIDLKLRMDGAGILFSEFNSIQSKLEETVSECDIDEQLNQRQQFEDCYYSTLSKAESLLGVGREVAECSKMCSQNQSSIKLPVITLPTFDGLYEHWLEYRDTYLSLVHNSTDISDIQKFHYLKSSLKGSAEMVVNALEISSENYSVAWELLLNRSSDSNHTTSLVSKSSTEATESSGVTAHAPPPSISCSRSDKGQVCDVHAYTHTDVHHAHFEVPDNVQLANTQFLGQQNIDILIGADRFWDLLIDGKIRLPNGPFLQNTKLGWIVSGPINHITQKYGHVQCNFNTSIENQLRQFWELEELTQPRNTQSDEETACEQSFVTTTTRDKHGRFIVDIPLKKSAEVLGESYSQAERRFFALEKRLLRAPTSYKQLYVDFMREYINLGHMTKVDSYSNPNYFLPHHGVFREHSTTTKLRVVFDASAATNNGISFNDIQLVGPPIQGDLLGILLRFRQFRYTALADCEKMYRSVLVNPTQRDLQLVVWRDEPSKPLAVYKLNTVTYGTASAPFLSVRCLKQLAAECSDLEVKRVINNDIYVDDLLTSSDDKDKLLRICKGTVDVLKSGCFILRNYSSPLLM
ncbi:uncharacterized protein LOC123721942 [Papilio machaon]|uniref:uncharacterized protein LOC123721942 n=1 Tax=Papilio machaon TaxID=76193 RepID=UPI001E662A85|nr:uncharacterized protein LOC123721942 [Papilio machaon]